MTCCLPSTSLRHCDSFEIFLFVSGLVVLVSILNQVNYIFVCVYILLHYKVKVILMIGDSSHFIFLFDKMFIFMKL